MALRFYLGRSEQEELWEGPNESHEAIFKTSGISDIQDKQKFIPDLEKIIRNSIASFDMKQFYLKDQIAEVNLFEFQFYLL